MAKGRLLEDATMDAYRQAGWEVLRGGWPDLLCFRRRSDSSFEVQLLECKSPGTLPRTQQREMHKALALLGFKVIVENGSLNGRPWIGSTAKL